MQSQSWGAEAHSQKWDAGPTFPKLLLLSLNDQNRVVSRGKLCCIPGKARNGAPS